MSRLPNTMKLIFIIAWLISCELCTFAADGTPHELLRSLDLKQDGAVWKDPIELTFSKRLTQMKKLKNQCVIEQKKVAAIVSQNNRLAAQLERLMKEHALIQKQLSGANSTKVTRVVPSRQKLRKRYNETAKQINTLQKTFKTASQLGKTELVRQAVIRLNNSRNRLAFYYLAFQKDRTKLKKKFSALQKDKKVIQAISRTGKGARLSNAKLMEKNLRHLHEAHELAFVQSPALYREDQHYRVSGIVNDLVPFTFSIRHSNGPTVIPDSLVQAAKIKIGMKNPRVIYTIGNKRRIVTRRVTIPSLRIGRVVLKNVKALALPPSAEDLGAKIAKHAFKDAQIHADGLNLQLQIQSD